MLSAQELPTPTDSPSASLRRLQLFDLLGQVFCFLGVNYILPFFTGNDSYLTRSSSGNGFSILFLLGGWQLLSALLHLFVWNRIPGSQQGRRLHLIVVGCLAVLCVLPLLSSDRLGDNSILILLGLLILSPILAGLYFSVTALDLWHLSATVNSPKDPIPLAGRRPVAVQAILLLVLLILFSGLSYFIGFGSFFSLLVIYTFLLGLAGWLTADYLKARRMKQQTGVETACAAWASVVLCCYIAMLLFHFQIPFYAFLLYVFLNPITVLSVWFAASLWRGPLRVPEQEPVPEDYENDNL